MMNEITNREPIAIEMYQYDVLISEIEILQNQVDVENTYDYSFIAGVSTAEETKTDLNDKRNLLYKTYQEFQSKIEKIQQVLQQAGNKLATYLYQTKEKYETEFYTLQHKLQQEKKTLQMLYNQQENTNEELKQAINNLNDQTMSQKEIITINQTKLNKKREESQILNATIDQLAMELTQNEQQLKELNKENHRYNQDLKEVQDDVTKTKTHNDEVKSQLQYYRCEIEDLKTKASNLSIQLKAIMNETDNFRNQNLELNDQLEEQKSQCKLEEIQVLDLQASLKEFTSELEELLVQKRLSGYEYDSLEEQMTEKEAQIQHDQDTITQIKIDLNALKAKERTTLETSVRLSLEQKTLATQLDQLHQEIILIQNQTQNKHSTINQLQETLTTHKHQLEQTIKTETIYQSTLEKIRYSLEEVKAKTQDLESARNKLKHTNECLVKTTDEYQQCHLHQAVLETKIEHKQQQIQNLTITNTLLQEKIKHLDTTFVQLEKENISKEQVRLSLKFKIEGQETAHKNLLADMEILNTNLRAEQENSEALVVQCQEVEKMIEEQKAKNQPFEKEYAKRSKILEKHQQESEAQDTKLTKLHDTIMQSIYDVDRIQCQIGAAVSKKQKMDEKLEGLKTKLRAEESKNKQINEDHDTLVSEFSKIESCNQKQELQLHSIKKDMILRQNEITKNARSIDQKQATLHQLQSDMEYLYEQKMQLMHEITQTQNQVIRAQSEVDELQDSKPQLQATLQNVDLQTAANSIDSDIIYEEENDAHTTTNSASFYSPASICLESNNGENLLLVNIFTEESINSIITLYLYGSVSNKNDHTPYAINTAPQLQKLDTKMIINQSNVAVIDHSNYSIEEAKKDAQNKLIKSVVESINGELKKKKTNLASMVKEVDSQYESLNCHIKQISSMHEEILRKSREEVHNYSSDDENSTPENIRNVNLPESKCMLS